MLDRCNKHTDMGLWMKPCTMEMFHKGTLRVVARSGDRSDPSDTRHIPLNTDIPVRFLKQLGNRDLNIQPILYPDDGTTVRRVDGYFGSISDLWAYDLAHATPDMATPELLRWYLSNLDNQPLYGLDHVISVYYIESRPKAVDPQA